MSLPTWNKMAQNVKLSAKKRYELLRTEINSISGGDTEQSTAISTLEGDVGNLKTDNTTNKGDISDLKTRVGALEQALETNHPSQQEGD